MEKKQNPSLIRIVQTDYYAFLSTLFVLMIWSVFAVFQLLRLESPSGAIYAALILTVIALGKLFYRYQIVNSLFTDGCEVSATITEIWFFRGRGRIDYAFSFRGHEYLVGDDVYPSRNARSFRNGDRISILINPDNPEHSIFYELYIDD